MKNRTMKMLLLAVPAVLTLTACQSKNAGGEENAAETAQEKETVSADDVIESVETIGFVDTDGAKLEAIAVRYRVDLTGAKLDTDLFSVQDFGTDTGDEGCDLGSEPGVPVNVYVNDQADISEEGGSGSGNYVIIEVNTDYQVSRAAKSYKAAMYAEITQTGTIETDSYTITPGEESFGNYTVTEVTTLNPETGEMREPEYYNYANEGSYVIRGIEGYELHTIDGEEGLEAFHAVGCFDEANGQYWDFDLPYALYVPEDYDPSQKYALVLHIHDAGYMGTDPMITLTEAQGPANFASDEVQQMAKDQGLGGIIVVAPSIAEDYYMDEDHPAYNLRSTRDNWTLSAAVPATWQLMDYITETYSIDMDRIYGSGQSMGGMQVLAMAAQRDNYFAGILPMSCKWGTNYNKEEEYDGSVYYAAPADGELIWTVDSDGNPCDYRNWYYLISDDNILFINTDGEYNEINVLYSDLAGVELPTDTMDPKTMPLEEQDQLVEDLTSRENTTGIYKLSLGGGVGHMSAWFYGHNISACYQWLLDQTRETEMNREKLPLNRPFVRADEQITTEERMVSQDRDNPEDAVYYVTGAFGSGTEGYNSAIYYVNGGLYKAPGWTVDHDETGTEEETEQTAASGAEDGQEGMWDEISLEVTEVMDNLYALDESRTRAYLVVGEDKALLIDTLFEEDNVLDVVRGITDLPVEVLITHGHPDHIGGIGYFDSCYINEKDAYLLPDGIQADYISEGDVIACGAYSFVVIEIPGHTEGSIALFDQNHRLLIAGDSVQPGPIVMFGEGTDLQAYINSMEKLMAYEDQIDYVLAGHHDFPVGGEYIQYAYEDALALVNGELTGTPMPAMGTTKNLYQGVHVSFISD